jgi:GNAT superfamily N-acetyltransferase
MSELVVRHLDPAEVARRAAELVDLYRAVYAEPPYHEGDEYVAAYARRLSDESATPGFTLVAANLGPDLVGYAYGVPFAAGEWWPDADHEPTEVVGQPAFAVMEFAVRKDRRGRGIGAALMGALLADRPEPYATLCANPAAQAHQIYQHWGWRIVARARPPQMPPMDVLLCRLVSPPPPAPASAVVGREPA